MRKFLFFVAIAVIAVLPGYVMAQNTDNVTATASAKILTAIDLSKITDLHFGTMVSTSSEGTCTVSATEESRTQTGGVTLLTQTPTFTRAYFEVEGDNSATYSITLPGNGTVTISDGMNDPMSIDDFTHSAGETPALDVSGAGSFYVGATLTVPANQPAGLYAGEFTVTVTYN